MADNTPAKRICRIMEEIDWPEWRNQTKAKRVRILQNILAASSATNDEKLGKVTERMEFFRYEDATTLKVRNLWVLNRPAAGTAEETAVLLEMSTLFLELFLDEYPVIMRQTRLRLSSRHADNCL